MSVGKSGVRIPFLTFADDTMIFSKACDQSCLLIKTILDHYCALSGQLVNFHKSAFQCSDNVPISHRANFGAILRMSEIDNLGEYLGCPIIDSRVIKNTFGKVLTKLKASYLNRRPILYLKQVGWFFSRII